MTLATALGNLAPYRSANAFAAFSAWSLSSAPQISARAALAPGCADFGSAARTLPVLWTLCRHRHKLHFIRNVLAHVTKGEREMVAAVFRTIFAQPQLEPMSRQWDKVRDELAARYPKIGPVMDAAKVEVLAFAASPPRALAQDLVHQPPRAAQQGDQTPLPRRRDLPQRSRRHPPHRSRPGRHPRRVGHRRTPLPEFRSCGARGGHEGGR